MSTTVTAGVDGKEAIVTGPANIGRVGTNYIPPQNIAYLSTGIEYIHSVPCMLTPTKCSITAEHFMANQYW